MLSVSTWAVVLSVLFCVKVAYAAINPDPELRVIQIGWLGIQEPASCIFSLAGFLLHFDNFFKFRGIVSRFRTYPYSWCVDIYHFLWMFTSFSAFLFHWHETKANEKADYYGVLSACYFGLWFGLMRVMRIKPDTPFALLIGAPVFLYASYVIYYMNFVLFDYGFHNKVCAVGLAFHAAFFCSILIRDKRATHARFLIYAHALLFSCSAFELLDFNPIFQIFDGHSLWHLSALPVGALLFEFLKADPEFMESRTKKESEA
eukprot:ANDGO_05305.mRNA.1 Protein PER1 homolog